MTGGLTISVLGILTWMKEHQSEGYMALEEIATPFQVNQDTMLRNLQWLQRYECVKHEGSGDAAWSITEHGRVRLAEGQFTPSGAFLSAFGRTETFSESNQDPAGLSGVLAPQDHLASPPLGTIGPLGDEVLRKERRAQSRSSTMTKPS